MQALFEIDPAGLISNWNTECEQMFGWLIAEAIGQPAHCLVPPRNHGRFDRELEGLALTEHATDKREITAVHRGGREFTIELTLSALKPDERTSVVAFAREMTPQQRAADAISWDPERYRAILDQIEDGCFVVDLRGNYLFVNDAMCRMFGWQRDQILGANFRLNTNPARHAETQEMFGQVFRTGRPIKSYEFEVFLPDKSVIYVEQSISLERDRLGRPIGFLGVIRDSTTRKLAEQESARAKEAAESANRAKSEFLANVSHEIRTPMNGIIGMSELVLDTELDSYQTDCVTTIRRQADTLLTIVNDILDFSKIESGRIELEAEPFSLADTVADAVKPLAVRADQKGLELLLQVDPKLPDHLRGDPGRLRQVLVNLIGNAIKFTERGEVVITASRGEAGLVHVEVADTGIGIPFEKQSRIFAAFEQADGSTTRKYGGTGLGLAISTQLIGMMGGRLWVESEVGLGSRFHLTAALPETGEGLQAEAPLDLTTHRVLIVDDNSTNRRILNDVLVQWGAHCALAPSGPDALVLFARAHRQGEPFDLVLLDVNMPDMDGFEVATRLRAADGPADPTILMLSSSDHSDDMRRCQELARAAYIIKPVTQAELRAAIARTLGTAAEPHGQPRPARRKAVADKTSGLRVLLAEDNAINQRLATRLLEGAGHRVTAVETGVAAIEAFERAAFDLVLMDLQMPEMGGIEATAAIRRIEAARGNTRTPIIALTAHAMTGDRERCIEASMDGYVSKPIRRSDLFAEVNRLAASVESVA